MFVRDQGIVKTDNLHFDLIGGKMWLHGDGVGRYWDYLCRSRRAQLDAHDLLNIPFFTQHVCRVCGSTFFSQLANAFYCSKQCAGQVCLSKACCAGSLDVFPCDDPSFTKKCGRNVHKPGLTPNYSFEEA